LVRLFADEFFAVCFYGLTTGVGAGTDLAWRGARSLWLAMFHSASTAGLFAYLDEFSSGPGREIRPSVGEAQSNFAETPSHFTGAGPGLADVRPKTG